MLYQLQCNPLSSEVDWCHEQGGQEIQWHKWESSVTGRMQSVSGAVSCPLLMDLVVWCLRQAQASPGLCMWALCAASWQSAVYFSCYGTAWKSPGSSLLALSFLVLKGSSWGKHMGKFHPSGTYQAGLLLIMKNLCCTSDCSLRPGLRDGLIYFLTWEAQDRSLQVARLGWRLLSLHLRMWFLVPRQQQHLLCNPYFIQDTLVQKDSQEM